MLVSLIFALIINVQSYDGIHKKSFSESLCFVVWTCLPYQPSHPTKRSNTSPSDELEKHVNPDREMSCHRLWVPVFVK